MPCRPRIVALVPARGGSKGIPRKNLARVGGVPLVVRSVRHALAAPSIDAVYVSTDDPEVAEVSRRAGAQIVDRPASIAGDTASTESAVEHFLTELEARGESCDVVVLLQCTSPFREPGQLEAAVERFMSTGCDGMLSAVRFPGFVWRREASGDRPLNYDPLHRPRRQEIDDAFLETGSFYVFSRTAFERSGSRLSGRIEVFEVPLADALEIDEPEDLESARHQAARHGDPELGSVAADLAWLVLDVDGTLTDGAMFYGEGGEEFKRFDTRDGMGLQRWREAGGRLAIVTGEDSEAARRRADKLKADHVVTGCKDKDAALRELRRLFGLDVGQVVAMGDDLNDLPMRAHAALFVAPSNGRPEVQAVADLVTSAQGGHGAVRELVDLLLRSRVAGSKLRRVA